VDRDERAARNENILKALKNTRRTYEDIGAEHGVSWKTVSRLRREWKLPPRRNSEVRQPHHLRERNAAILAEFDAVSPPTQAEVAEKFGLTKQRINAIRKSPANKGRTP